MSDSTHSGAGLGVLALVALVVCCAAPLLISAGVLAAVGAWLCNAIVIAVAAVLVGAAVFYALYRRRRGAACPPASTDAGNRHRERARRRLLRASTQTRLQSWVRVDLAEIDGLEIHDRGIGERLVS